MTLVTFGVSASSFVANMSVKQNAIDYSHEYPMAAEVVKKAFYVDDCLTGATDSKSALTLQQQLSYSPVVDLRCENGTPIEERATSSRCCTHTHTLMLLTCRIHPKVWNCTDLATHLKKRTQGSCISI